MRHWTTSFLLFNDVPYALPYESSQGFSVNRFVIRIEFSINLTISTILTFMFRKGRPFPQSNCVVIIQVCAKTLIEILAPRHHRTSKKQGNGEADGSGQVFHTGSLAENGNEANTLVGAPSAGKGISQRGWVNAGCSGWLCSKQPFQHPRFGVSHFFYLG